MVATPPTLRAFKEIEEGTHECYRKLVLIKKKVSSVKKAQILASRIEFLQNINNVYGPYMRNTYDALEEKNNLDVVFARVIVAIAEDKKLIKDAWIKMQAFSGDQIEAFS